MFVEDRNGDLVNLEMHPDVFLFVVNNSSYSVRISNIFPDNNDYILFHGTEESCLKYLDELKKELAAFGKLIQVKMD